jgi:ADP-heptose:LPS heptosyltransferase
MVKARPSHPRFSGGFKSFTVALETNREKRVESRLIVFSQGSRTKVHQFLWHKFLWEELSQEEYRLFILMPETLNSKLMVGALRALLILSKKKVRELICNKLTQLGEKAPSRESYLGYRRLNVEIYEYRRSLPKTPKFSGWVKSASSVGSKQSRKVLDENLEPLAIYLSDYEDIIFDWYSYLTVEGSSSSR